MNIIFAGNFSYPYGMAATRRVQLVIDYFESVGVTTRVLILNSKKNGSGRLNQTTYKHVYFLRLFSLFFQLIKWKYKEEKNILYVYDGINIQNIGLIVLSRLLKYKIVTDIVEDYAFQQENGSFLFRLKIFSTLFFEKFINRFTDGIIVISTYLERKFQGSSRNKIPLLLLPISADINRARIKNEFNNPVQFVYSGSFGNKDGLQILIGAFTKVIVNYPDCVLILTGTTKNKDRIKQLKVNDKIIIKGYLNELDYYNLIRDADILCITRNSSKYATAGFPFKLGEYLATGNPVICSRVSDVELYLENGKDAIIIEPDNIACLKNAMEYLLNNKENAFEIGKNGSEKCVEHFNPVKNGVKLGNFLSSI